METVSKSLAETEQIAADFLARLAVGSDKTRGATVVGLQGNLGAGKTAFAQAVGKILGITDWMASPTFVLIKNYKIKCQGLPLTNKGKGNPFYPWRKLVHIDCYRLDDSTDLEKLGWWELTTDQSNLILIEWPDRVAKILPINTINIQFEILSETERKITYDEKR